MSLRRRNSLPAFRRLPGSFLLFATCPTVLCSLPLTRASRQCAVQQEASGACEPVFDLGSTKANSELARHKGPRAKPSGGENRASLLSAVGHTKCTKIYPFDKKPCFICRRFGIINAASKSVCLDNVKRSNFNWKVGADTSYT